MLASGLNMDSQQKDIAASSSSEASISYSSDYYSDHFRGYETPSLEPSGRVPGRSRSFDRRGAACLADLLKSAMVVSGDTDPDSLMKRGGNGSSRQMDRGASPPPRKPKRCRSVTEDVREDEDNDLVLMSQHIAALKALGTGNQQQR
jgi:hypothetical protein